MRAAAALNRLVPTVIQWPTKVRRLALKCEIFDKWRLPSCVGFLDGLHVPLARRPAMPLESARGFFDRKKDYSLLLIAACDHTKRFIWARTGYNGAASDIRAQNESELTTAPQGLFSNGEWLLTDAGLRCTEHVIPMYSRDGGEDLEPHEVSLHEVAG